jgi:hypothetical protein
MQRQHKFSVSEGELGLAIHQTHNCEAESLEGVVDVNIPLGTRARWEGKVHIFKVSGHSKASRCYAWGEALDDTTIIVCAVLHSGRVTSPEQAVKSTLRRRTRRARPTVPLGDSKHLSENDRAQFNVRSRNMKPSFRT